jgi:hypothetical protein
MPFLRALIVAILLGNATMTPAHAGTVYAYWSYWQGDSGVWQYAQVGPATSPAIDGAVDGWRFTLGSDGKAARPSSAADFASICGGTAKPENGVRVAVIIDFGTASQSTPTTYCAVVETGLSRMSALGAVVDLRLKNGFICAINAVPEDGCGDVVIATSTPLPLASTSPAPATTTQPQHTGSAAPIGIAPATSESSSLAAAEPTAQTAGRPKGNRDQGSPLSTVITMILAGIALALALRNAKRQQAAR